MVYIYVAIVCNMDGSSYNNARTPARFTRRLLLLGVGLTILFTATSPEITGALSLASRFTFWLLHIGIGLGTATWTAHALVTYTSVPRDWRLIVLAGIGGVVLFAPAAVSLEWLFPSTDQGADSDWADQWARTSVLAAIAVEGFELAPSYLAAWALINIESFNSIVKDWSRSTVDQADMQALDDTVAVRASTSKRTVTTNASAPEGASDDSDQTNEFLSRLPAAVGTQVICVSSDLHYLDVVTRKGTASVLGSLSEVEQLFANQGLRVHRSHWVCLEEVMQLRKAGSGWLLDMSNGSSIPVSRRKRRCVSEALGSNFTRLSVAS